MKRSLTTKRMSMTGKPINSNTKKDDYTWVWIIVAILILMFFFSGTCWYNGTPSDNFANTMKSGLKNTIDKFSGKSNPALKELDIMYFMSPSCPWCQKMNKLLEDEGVLGDLMVVDVTTTDGKKLATETGAASKGIPAFISRAKKTGTIGFKQSVQELIDSLSKKQEAPSSGPVTDDMINVLQNLQVVVFVSPSCGWCNKFKTELQENGCIDVVELVDVSSENGKAMAQELLKEMRGVPASFSRATGKQTSGYKPVVKLIEELS